MEQTRPRRWIQQVNGTNRYYAQYRRIQDGRSTAVHAVRDIGISTTAEAGHIHIKRKGAGTAVLHHRNGGRWGRTIDQVPRQGESSRIRCTAPSILYPPNALRGASGIAPSNRLDVGVIPASDQGRAGASCTVIHGVLGVITVHGLPDLQGIVVRNVDIENKVRARIAECACIGKIITDTCSQRSTRVRAHQCAQVKGRATIITRCGAFVCDRTEHHIAGRIGFVQQGSCSHHHHH